MLSDRYNVDLDTTVGLIMKKYYYFEDLKVWRRINNSIIQYALWVTWDLIKDFMNKTIIIHMYSSSI